MKRTFEIDTESGDDSYNVAWIADYAGPMFWIILKTLGRSGNGIRPFAFHRGLGWLRIYHD